MIKLYELAEYNAMRKNKTRRITQTHKDVVAFLMLADFWFLMEHLLNGNITEVPRGLYVS